MVRELATICDICKEKKAVTKCFLCGKDICEEHNLGGEYSSIQLTFSVYSDNIIDMAENRLLDCCTTCIQRLDKIIENKNNEIKNKFKEDLTNLKYWIVNEFKVNQEELT